MLKVIALVMLLFSLTGCKNNVNTDVEIKPNELVDNIQEELPSTDTGKIETPVIEEQETEKEIVESKVEEVNVNTSNLDNKTYAWGFRRMKDEKQPEFTASYANVLKKYDGIYVGNAEEKIVYLTFDEGYENGYTPAILDTLKEKEVQATFFVTQPYVKKNPELVQRMIDEGHIVGNHTVNHPSMPSVTDDEKLKKEVMDLHNYVKDNFGYEMSFLRPPKGEYSERTVALSKNLGYTTVLWSQAYDDWDVNNQKGLEYAKKMILNNLHNGAVILLHAVSKDNTEVLGEIIDEIQNRGYEIMPLDEFEY